MRVIAGALRSRKLKTLAGSSVRPTPDRLRESLFNILAPRIEGTIFLDAYAGTGAVGIEALSRGARHAVLIERHARALEIIRENVRSLGLEDAATVVRGNAAALLRNYPCDIAFVDPPYEDAGEYAASLNALAETNCSLVIAQHESRATLAKSYGGLLETRKVRQGENTLTFFQRAGYSHP